MVEVTNSRPLNRQSDHASVEARFPIGGGFVGTSAEPATSSLAAESLLSLAVTVTSEQHVESVLHSIVDGLAAQPGVALSRIWLLPSVHLPSFYHAASDPPDCLCLVASAGTAISSPGRIGPSCRGTLHECGSTSEKLVRWQQPVIRFSSKTSPLKTIGLCDQDGRNGRRFAVLQVIPSSFEKNC
jgi:hypothetical protein